MKVVNSELLNAKTNLNKNVVDIEQVVEDLYGVKVRYRKFGQYFGDDSIIGLYSLGDGDTTRYLSVDSELVLEEKRFVIAYLLGKRSCGYKSEATTEREIYKDGYFLEKAYSFASDMLIPDNLLNDDLAKENYDVSILAKEYLVPEIVMEDKIKRKVRM